MQHPFGTCGLCLRICGLEEIARLPGLEGDPDLVAAVLQEAARLSGEVLAPINQGDRQGSRLIDGVVRTPDRWQEAYTTFVEGAGAAP